MEDHVAVPISAEPADEPALPAAPHASHVIARLADDVIPVLIERLAASKLGELEVRQDGWRVRLRRAPLDGDSAVAAAATSTRPRARQADEASDPPRAAQSRPRPMPDGTTIGSPAVGYYQPRGGLAKGAAVRGGDLLGHVDVLGVLHDVAVPEDGRLTEQLAEPGEAVEYGQPLARLEPESRT